MNELSTKDRILNSAESLFSERGIDATSLRDITSHAGVNLAAVNYHFRSKDELVWAVYERHVISINAERLEGLEKLEQQTTPTLEQILDAFFRPIFAAFWGENSKNAELIPLMARMYTERSYLKIRLLQQMKPIAERYLISFARQLPHLSQKELTWRVHYSIGALIHVMMNRPIMEMFLGEPIKDPVDLALGRLVTFAAAGLRAPAYSKEEAVDA